VRFRLATCEDDLWHEVVVRLLAQRDIDEEQAHDHLRLLEELAFHRRFCGKPLTRDFAENTGTWLAESEGFDRVRPRRTAQGWLAELEYWQLLERRSSGREAIYDFTMPSLDEYFAARHLAARWGSGDRRYLAWLPCSPGWFRRHADLQCPNPYCGSALLPFDALLRRPEYEETLLLTVGLLAQAEWEDVLLNGIRAVDLKLKVLSRCRHEHPGVVQAVQSLIDKASLANRQQGLSALKWTRVRANLDPILDHCIRALAAPNECVAAKAARVLGQLGHQRAVEPLIATLRDQGNRLTVFQAVTQALVQIGAAAVEPLITALENPHEHWRVRNTVPFLLGRIGDPRAVRPLIWALGDPSYWVHGGASEALVRIGTDAVSLLIAALDHPRATIRRGSAVALGQIGDRRAVAPLNSKLKDEEPWVRESSARALGHIGDARSIFELHTLLDENQGAVRQAAKWACQKIERENCSENK
jgi:HEAT repeat protein